MKKQILILACVAIFSLKSYSQVDTVASDIPLLSLGLNQLEYPVDSSRMKIISAGKISKSLDELPLQVIIISEEEILNNQYTTLGDVINGLPGILVSKPGTAELGESFQMWNMTGNLYTKILINGIEIKPSVVSGMPLGSQLPIRQAEKIEIIYGNSSAIYGADAVAGVINIVTRTADQGTFVRGDINLGGYGHNYINFTVGGKAGKNNNILQYTFYGSKYEMTDLRLDYEETGIYNPLRYYEANGDSLIVGSQDMLPSEINEAAFEDSESIENFMDSYYGSQYEGSLTMPDMEALGSASNMLGMQLSYKGFSLQYNYMYRRTHSSLGLSPAFFKYNNPQNYWGENIQRTCLEYKKEFKGITSITQINNLSYQMDNNSSQGLTFIEETDKLYRYSASNDLELSQVFMGSPFKNAELVLGYSYVQSGNLPLTNYRTSPFNKSWYTPYSEEISLDDIPEEFDRIGINPVLFFRTSLYTQFYYQYKKFRFLAGIRHDYNKSYEKNNISPQLAILHKTTEKTSFRFSIGTGYKIPPTSLIYQTLVYPYNDKLNVVAHPIPGNILQPERFTTFEFGFVSNLSKKISIEQSFFSYRISNHITPYEIPANYFFEDTSKIANDYINTWINLSTSTSTVGGSQTIIHFKNLFPSVKLNADLGLYFQARQDRFGNLEQFLEDYINLTPRHSGKLKISMEPARNMYLSIESHWMSKWLRILIPFDDLYENIFGESDGYYAMNVAWSYKLSNNLRVHLKGNNIFNEKYYSNLTNTLDENLIYNPQLGRTILLGLSYKLN